MPKRRRPDTDLERLIAGPTEEDLEITRRDLKELGIELAGGDYP